MMKHRWAIPATLAAVCFVLAGLSVVLTRSGPVGKVEKNLQNGQSVVVKGLELKKDHLHTLHIVPAFGVGLNQNFDVSATLTQGDAVIFEVADSYWHERGVWREGGESGTWQEQNSQTEFEFRVPETGTYELEISLDGSNVGQLPFRAAITWTDPWLLSLWPLLLGGVFLLGLSGFSAYTAGGAYAKSLLHLGRGSKIKLMNEVFEVLERSEHWELAERVGVDLRVRSSTGIERWVSVSSWWRENPMDDEQGTTLWQIFVGVPLTDDEKTLLGASTPGDMSVMVRGQRMQVDRDNSGGGTMVTERAGEIYVAHYYNWAYRSGFTIPRRPGEMWLECTVWRMNNESEWWLSKLLDWKTVEIVEDKPARMINYAEIQKARANPNPFGRGTAAEDGGFSSPTAGSQSAAAWQAPGQFQQPQSGQQPRPQQTWQPPSQQQQQPGQQTWQPPSQQQQQSRPQQTWQPPSQQQQPRPDDSGTGEHQPQQQPQQHVWRPKNDDD
jgi:hypothetical protein